MPQLEFDHVIQTLGLTAHRDAWRRYWPETDGIEDVCDSWLFAPGRLEHVRHWLGIPQEQAAALHESLVSALSVPERRALLAQVIRTLSLAPTGPAPMPELNPALGPWAALFQALAVLGCVPETRRKHELRCIPDSVTRDTFNDVSRWLGAYRQSTGQWGFRSAFWIHNHISGRLVELGRLQFGRSPSDLPFHVFRGKGPEAGRVLALAADGSRIRPDGQFLTADRGIDKNGPHVVTRFDLDETRAVGHAVNPAGGVEQTAVTLPLDRWSRVMEPGTPVLDVHIPAGAPLDDAAVADSFRRAAAFFPRYFPEFTFAGFTCTSWLIDPQLALRLPAEANTVKFLKRFHWAPHPTGNDFQTFERVFGGPVADIATAPRDSTMKRAVLAHVEAGGRWRYASGFILRDEA